jgi:hypothetical protein
VRGGDFCAPRSGATFPLRDRALGLRPKIRRCVREPHESGRTKPELRHVSQNAHAHAYAHAYALAHPHAHTHPHADATSTGTHAHARAHAHAHAVNKENECEYSDQCALTLAGRSRAALRTAYESDTTRRSVSATGSARSANEQNERFAERERYNIPEYRTIECKGGA